MSPLNPQRRSAGAALRSLIAGMGLLAVLAGCGSGFAGSGPWKVSSFHPGARSSSDDREIRSSWALLGERGSRLQCIYRSQGGALERQVVVFYLAADNDAGRWDDGGSSSQSDGQWIQTTVHLEYVDSDQGMNHEQDLGYRASWESGAPGAPLDFEEVQFGGRGLPVASDLFVLVRASQPGSLLTCEIDPAWPELEADAVGFLDAVCAAHPDIDAVLQEHR